MEVHHHPHVGKKSFKEYILEGLMIFVAVSMGFIAESIREHITESKHEKELMKSLVNDLKLDTAYLNSTLKSRDGASKASITLLQYFKENPTTYKLPSSLFYQLDSSRRLLIFFPHSGSFDQLKNSGSLRLLNNRALTDSIESYYQQIKRIDNLNSIYLNEQEFTFALQKKIIRC
jgi:hypothetical protein